VYIPRKHGLFWYGIVNTLHKGDNKDDVYDYDYNYDDNNNNNDMQDQNLCVM